MCGGPSSTQQQLQTEQANFYSTLTQEYSTVFGETQGILSELTNTFEPILAKGPNQEGFSPEEKANLNTQAIEGTAQNFNQANTALNEKLAAEGGGDEFLPSGAKEQLNEELSASSSAEQSREESTILSEDYAAGKQQFDEAAAVLAGQEAGVGSAAANFAGATTGAGSSAEKTASDIASEENSWLTPVMGAVGGILGGAAGNLNVGPFSKS